MAIDTVAPVFRAAIAAASRDVRLEGRLEAVPHEAAQNLALYEAEDGGVHLQLRLKKRKIVEAVHSGVEDLAERGVMDTFCALLVGLPIQEAADHAGIHLTERLRDSSQPRPARGILTPGNADPIFRRPVRLIRKIHESYQDASGDHDVENFWNPVFSKDWLKLPLEDQAARLKPLLVEFLSEREQDKDDLYLTDIENGSRVIIAFAEHIGHDEKPSLIMDLERKVRNVTGQRLEFYMAEMKDTNRIRRL